MYSEAWLSHGHKNMNQAIHIILTNILKQPQIKVRYLRKSNYYLSNELLQRNITYKIFTSRLESKSDYSNRMSITHNSARPEVEPRGNYLPIRVIIERGSHSN